MTSNGPVPLEASKDTLYSPFAFAAKKLTAGGQRGSGDVSAEKLSDRVSRTATSKMLREDGQRTIGEVARRVRVGNGCSQKSVQSASQKMLSVQRVYQKMLSVP